MTLIWSFLSLVNGTPLKRRDIASTKICEFITTQSHLLTTFLLDTRVLNRYRLRS